MDERVRKVLTALTEAGYEAYVVGGAVRDMLRHVRPHDYDVTTSARPDDIRAVAQAQGWHMVEIKSERFGIVVLVVDDMTIETATFRGESYGSDSHRPEQVWYADKLAEDVQRRDFTVNALAMDKDGHIVDYVGGQKDIKRKGLLLLATQSCAFMKMHCVSFGRAALLGSSTSSRPKTCSGLCPRPLTACRGYL